LVLLSRERRLIQCQGLKYLHWILIISTKPFISLKIKNVHAFMLLLYIYFIIRYHQFKDEWKAKKAPGEKSHKNLRWNVRVMSDYVVFSLFHISLTESFRFFKIGEIILCSQNSELILMSSFVLFPKGKNVAV